ncbi:hypothetical protein [uncultured Ruminococcus sp.]|uniref:hypothetical protein n=1 Tax=uncultured Ruminococcus sp. TaxID=165186 RepID=UPI00292F5ADC|nr:hypothetical protein [uncultured Ruminococcus sp.]
MKNFAKILCVVLALVMALTAASCSMSKQFAYQKDDVELPIGTYILYLQQAYNQAQGFAQKSDLYDSEKGTYDGKKSFLKMEITDDDGETAVAEDWIIKKAEDLTIDAIAGMNKAKELGCTLDEAAVADTKEQIKSFWDQGYGEQYEQYGIGMESLIALSNASTMRDAAFHKQYSAEGPTPVSDEELAKYFTENYTSYKYFSANLYTSTTATDGAEEGSDTAQTVDTPLSDEEIAKYQKDFEGYASTLSGGGSFDDVLKQYMEAYNVTEDPHTENVAVLDDSATDEVMKTIKEMKDGQAMTITVGDDADSKQIYLIYREPIEKQVDAYTKTEEPKAEATGDEAAPDTTAESNRDTVLEKMKSDEFDELMKKYAKDAGIALSSACKNYKPSMFEATK